MDTTRRSFLQVASTLPVADRLASTATASPVPAPRLPHEAAVLSAHSSGIPPDQVLGPDLVPVVLIVNGEERTLAIEPSVTLADAIRDRLALHGTKIGCAHGQCGACTVLINGQRRYSCITLAIVHQGARITTIEGVAQGEELHPLQQAFIEHDALQCGYCTPGQILSGLGLLAEGHAQTEQEIREGMNGNICRCAAYQNIVAAIREVQTRSKVQGAESARLQPIAASGNREAPR